MLADAERKVLRIIANYSAIHRRMPSFLELGRKTGKSRERLSETLAELEREGYISWSPAVPERIILLRAWEDRDQGKDNAWRVYGSM